MSVRPHGFAETSRQHIQLGYLLRRVGEALTLLRRELLLVVRPVLILLLLLRLRAELLILLIRLT